MSHIKRSLVSLGSVLLAIGLAGSAHAQTTYYLTGGGGQGAVGNGLPLPIQTFPAGQGTGTVFPPLLVPPILNATVQVIPDTGTKPPMISMPNLLVAKTDTATATQGVYLANSALFQVKTQLRFSGPHPTLYDNYTVMGAPTASAMLLPPPVLRAGGTGAFVGGRTGAKTTTIASGNPGGGLVRYSGSANHFGGPSQQKLTGVLPVSLFAAVASKPPCTHPAFGGTDANCIALMIGAHPGTVVALGGPTTYTNTTVGGPPPDPTGRLVAAPSIMGTITMSAGFTMDPPAPLNNAATSRGFPLTTGMLEIKQPSAMGSPESFTITGQDNRTANGAGNIQLVSAALSDRVISGPNSNRGWLVLNLSAPEPTAILGAAGALGMLALCHGLARRRSR